MDDVKLMVDKHLLYIGESAQLNVMVTRPQVRVIGIKSDNETVAHVDFLGNIKATGNGWAKVMVEYEANGAAQTKSIVITVAEKKVLQSLKHSHPRLILTEECLDRVHRNIKTDSRVGHWYDQVKAEAEKTLDCPSACYEETVRGGTTYSPYAFTNHLAALAMIYWLEKDQRYLNKALEDMLAACSFPDWGEAKTSLYIGLMNFAMGIGYDWLYPFMTEEQRNTICRAICNMGITPLLKAYQRTLPKELEGLYSFTRTNTNHNSIPNCSLGISALAVAAEEPELAEEAMQNVLLALPIVLKELAPDGGYMEGPLYWTFGMGVFPYFVNSLETALGSDQGYWGLPGVSGTGYLPMYTLSPTGLLFNYGDANEHFLRQDRGGADILFYFAKAFNNPELAWFNAKCADREPHVWSILGYDPAICSELQPSDIPKDRYFRGEVQLGSFRSQWTESLEDDGIYLGFKGGKGKVNHGDMDAGTFVLDALGERWAWELGRDEPYPAINYFHREPGHKRWHYYKNRAEGHNTLLINPDGTDGQDVEVAAEIIRFEANEEDAFAVMDMTHVYKPYAAVKAERGFRLYDRRSRVLVQDEILTSRPSDIWWFMHTKSAIEIGSDGKSALLKQGLKYMKVCIKSNQEVKLMVLKAEGLPSSYPAQPNEQSREEFRKLAIYVEGVKALQLSVEFIPLDKEDAKVKEMEKMEPLKEWRLKV